MKKAILLLLLLVSAPVLKAQIYIATSCEVSFFSAAPLENIEAVNKSARPVLSTATNDIQVKIPISNFQFEKALMQEHFNENYMETEKYPNAIFKGKIQENIDWSKDGVHKVTVKGNLEIHGVTKERTLDGTVTIKDGKIMIASKFMVRVADHNIKVPSMYIQNIAESVAVTINATLEPYKKN